MKKHYYLNDKEISEEEAKEVEIANKKYLNSGNFENWAKIKFIFIKTI